MSQIIQLGIFQKETTLPSSGRSFVSSGNELSSIEGRSADGTLHADFIKNNRTFQLSYSVVSEADKDLITDIYLSQIEEDSFLNFEIYSFRLSFSVHRFSLFIFLPEINLHWSSLDSILSVGMYFGFTSMPFIGCSFPYTWQCNPSLVVMIEDS